MSNLVFVSNTIILRYVLFEVRDVDRLYTVIEYSQKMSEYLETIVEVDCRS